MDKKLYLAQLAAKAIFSYRNEDAICDVIWLMNSGIGDAEDQWENFEQIFKDAFGITYNEAQQLNLF